MKKSLVMVLALGMTMVNPVDCGSETSETAAPDMAAAQIATAGTTAADTMVVQTETLAAGAEGPIAVVPREGGSGTRGASIELFGVEVKSDAGEKGDMTMENAEITNSTSIMMMTVAGNMEAVGYISLGPLSGTMKAVKIDGVGATVDSTKSGGCEVARPFSTVIKRGMSEVAADFIKYMMSEEGQKVVEDNGYISQGNEGAYGAAGASGKIVVAGFPSATPVMERLKEAYVASNPGVTTEVQQSDSITGTTSAVEGVCDIGMASRELKDMELKKDVKGTVIVTDGIAAIVNNDSPIEELNGETIKGIYTGETIDWADTQ